MKVLVPQLFVRKLADTLEELANTVELPVPEVLSACLPAVLVHILPVFAVSKQDTSQGQLPGMDRRVKQASDCYDVLVDHLGQEVSCTVKPLKSSLLQNTKPVNSNMSYGRRFACPYDNSK
jgi:hypothetical protein